ncbi:MAG: DUF3854 domain-containing protein, partial [Actinomycetota bacterium]
MRTKKATTRNLLPHHLKLIKGSGIKDEVAEARGYRSITKPATLSRLGFSEKQAALVPALLHPIWDVFGENTRAQSRPDNPRLRDEKPIRYENVPKMGVALDVNPLARERVLAPRDDLFITEGIRKGDSLASRGLAAIALLGVWNWRGTDKSGALTALADWEKVSLKGRTVNIIFDSDVIT